MHVDTNEQKVGEARQNSPLQTVEIGSDLFSTDQYNFLFGQARMKSSSYDIEGKNHGGVYPR